MKKLFASNGFKIFVALIAIFAVIVVSCNIVFYAVAANEQKGEAKGYAWSEDMAFDESLVEKLEMKGDNFKVLVITDVHLRNHGTFAAALGVNYILDGISRPRISHMIKRENPDLIIVTGDQVLTKWNDIATQQFADFMDSFEIPWAPVFGNHDMEGRADKAKLCDIYLASEYCLFQYGPADLNGAGNYIVNVEKDNKAVYSFFLFDDGEPTDEGYGTINEKQIDWYKWAVKGIAEKEGKTVKNMAFMHIAVPEFLEIAEDDYKFGEKKENPGISEANYGFFDAFKANGGTHMFAGHDHINNFYGEYEGVDLCYVTKSSYNCYIDLGMLGGTVININSAGEAQVQHVEF